MDGRHRPRGGGKAAVAALVAAWGAATAAQRVAGERHVAAASGHICVVQDGGAVGCYGNPATNGKLSPPTGVAFHAVTVGDDFSCGLATNGSSLRCWGALPGGNAQLPPASTFFVDVHAGPRHVCGLVPNGTVFCYGNATSLGAVNVPPNVVFQGVTAGVDYTCGVARNHTVVCWGDGNNLVVKATATWQSITDAEHVAAGADHACYVRVNGSVACWGSNSRGAATPPAALATNGSVWWLAAGGGMTCAIAGSSVPGVATCWGAVSGNIANAAFEVACAGWGCVASAVNSVDCGGASGRVCALGYAANGGTPMPQGVGRRGSDAAAVTTLAGNGESGSTKGVGTAAQFNQPRGVSLDGAGGLYVADSYNHAIRRVDIASRAVTTVAGVAGTSGTTVGATPLQSKFNQPYGVEGDDVGNVYVADTFNNAIRMLTGTWIAGTGASGAVDGAGASATFALPYVVRADVLGGVLYVAERDGCKVRTIATASTTTVATLATFTNYAYDIALNPSARLMYVGVLHSVIIVSYTGTYTLLAGATASSGYGDGTGTTPRFNCIIGLALDAGAGVLYATDWNNHRIRRITTAGGVVTTLAGSGTPSLTDGTGTAATFYKPWGIVLDPTGGLLYIGDCNNHAIRQMQIQPPGAVGLIAVPLPPSPLAPTHQLTAWRALGINSTIVTAQPVLDARNVTFSVPLSAANTAGLNSIISTLLLGSVTLAPRDAPPTAASNLNITFSTSARLGLQSLVLKTANVPVAALALSSLTNLTLTVLKSEQLLAQELQLSGLPALSCLNCDGTVGLANLSGMLTASTVSIAMASPLISTVDLSGNSITGIGEHDFDGMSAIRSLLLSGNNLTYVSDAAFSVAKQPALAEIDQSGTPLVTGGGCRAGSYMRVQFAPTTGAPYAVCSACPGGAVCNSGPGHPQPCLGGYFCQAGVSKPCPGGKYCPPASASPLPCPSGMRCPAGLDVPVDYCTANTYSLGGAAANCAVCPTGTYTASGTTPCTPCTPGIVASTCNDATATWRDVLTVVADGADGWANATILVVPRGQQPSSSNVSTAALRVLSPTSVAVSLPFVLPAATYQPVDTQLWVVPRNSSSTSDTALPLNLFVTLVPPPQQVALAAGVGLAAPATGVGTVVLRLPAPRLTAADWDGAYLAIPPAAVVDDVKVWLGGTPCTSPAWTSTTTVACNVSTTAQDAVDVAVAVQLSGAFNVTGVLPSLRSSPALAASANVQLLPPLTAAGSINITLVGVALCAGSVPHLTSASIGGVPCTAIACIVGGDSDAALCVGWNATAAAPAMLANATVLLAVAAALAGTLPRTVMCDACITLAQRPSIATVSPATIAAPGTPIVVTGTGFFGFLNVTATSPGSSAGPPTVIVGDAPCTAVTLLLPDVVRCITPSLQVSVPGFPVVSVVVTNAAGASSTDAISVIYPATFAVSWVTTPSLVALPGGLLAPAPSLTVLSRDAASCTLSINASACANYDAAALASRPSGMTIAAPPSSLVVSASGTTDAAATTLSLTALVASGASGCDGDIVASCIDGVGLTASTAGQPSPVVTFIMWHAEWTSGSGAQFSTVVPEAIPPADVIVSVSFPPGAAIDLSAAAPADLACLALLLPISATMPSLDTPLERVSVRDVLSSVPGSLGASNATSVAVRFVGLSAAAARLGQALALYAECTWTPSGERVRLPSIPVGVATAAIALSLPAVGVVDAYEAVGLTANASLLPPGVATFVGAAGTCTWRVVSTTSPSLVLSAITSSTVLGVTANGSIVGSAGAALELTLEGPPGATMALQLACSLWGVNTVTSPLLTLTTHDYAVVLRGGLGTSRAVWPSGVQSVLPWAEPVDVAAPARGVLTCGVEVSNVALSPPQNVSGIGLGLADSTVQLAGTPSVTAALPSAATRANVSLSHVGLRAPGGTNASLALTCRDGVGRSAALGAPLIVSVAALSAAWSVGTVSSMPAVVVPTQPLPPLTLTLTSTPAVPLPRDADVGALVTCVAALVRASTTLPLDTPLATLLAATPPYASALTTTAGSSSVVVGADNASIVITLPPLSTAACPLSTPLTAVAECTWTPTGERVRLPSLATATLPLVAAWVAPPTSVLGYSSVPLHMVVTLAAPVTNTTGVAAGAHCEISLLNTTTRGVSVLADTWMMAVDAGAPAGTSIAADVNITLQAPPGATAFVQVDCGAWGQVFSTPPLRLTAATLTLTLLSEVPSSFIASDTSSPWPLDPLLALQVTTDIGAVVTDVSCAVATSTPAAEFKVVGGGIASLQAVAAHAATGIVSVPPFVVQASPTMEAVVVSVECRRSSGDAPPPLTFTVPAVKLRAELCDTPQTTSEVGTPLAGFAVGVVTEAANGSVHHPCAATASLPTAALPSIVCSIGLDTATTTTNDTTNIFLQHTVATMSASSHRATFDAFTLVAPQGQTFGLTLTCAVGGLAIPPSLSFSVTLAGCRVGQEAVSVACVTCGDGSFSLGGMGARCTGCPPEGATCIGGILTLLPHYFRPAAQADAPLGPTTELHPCYNSEACTLEYSGNASGAIYGCAHGYTGPLCGVCDARINYARFGDACDVCWDPSASAFFLAVVIIVVLAVLTHMALFSEVYNSYPDDAIILRITLGYLQGVGSLRVFIAGSTQAYASVMGWTEVVSASPLSVGALQCLLRLSYLTQYASTVLLPVLASVIVIVIFLVGTTARSVRCRQRGAAGGAAATAASNSAACCWMDSKVLISKVAAWWASKRHISTMLFVLFLTYMPITSASLRVLDCIPPVAGIRYLRSNLAVECGVGEHAAARVLAYSVLVGVGIGFPAGLAWLLGTARKEQLLDTGFHATWGFLFDGYRAPTRKLVAVPGGDTGASAAKAVPPPPASAAPKLPALAATAGLPSRRDVRQRRRSSILPDRLLQTWVVEGDSRVWWEALVLTRKAGVVLLAVLVTNPYIQCVGATLWFFCALVLQLEYAPYAKTKFNRLELATLTATFVTAIISAALLQFNVDVATADLHPPAAMTPIEWAVTIALVVINMGMLATLGFLWLRVQWQRARTLARNIPRPRSLSWSRRRSGGVVVVGGGGRGSSTGIAVASRSSSVGSTGKDEPAGGGDSGIATTANPLRSGTSLALAAASRVDSTGGTDAPCAVAAPAPAPPQAVAAASRRVVFTPMRLGAGADDASLSAGTGAAVAAEMASTPAGSAAAGGTSSSAAAAAVPHQPRLGFAMAPRRPLRGQAGGGSGGAGGGAGSGSSSAGAGTGSADAAT